MAERQRELDKATIVRRGGDVTVVPQSHDFVDRRELPSGGAVEVHIPHSVGFFRGVDGSPVHAMTSSGARVQVGQFAEFAFTPQVVDVLESAVVGL